MLAKRQLARRNYSAENDDDENEEDEDEVDPQASNGFTNTLFVNFEHLIKDDPELYAFMDDILVEFFDAHDAKQQATKGVKELGKEFSAFEA